MTDLQLKKITCLVRQLHHEDGLPNSKVYLLWAVGQSLCSALMCMCMCVYMHLCAHEQQITLAGSYKSEPLLQHVLEILPTHLQDFCPECTNHLLHAEYHADPTASTHVDRDDFAQVVQVGLPELESLGLTTRAAATLSGAAWSQQQQGVEWKPSLCHTKQKLL